MSTFYVRFTGTQEWVPMEANSAHELATTLKAEGKTGTVRRTVPEGEGVKMMKNDATPASAIVKLEKLSPEEVAWITSKLEEKVLPFLEADVSNYAKGRQRVWLPYEAPLGNQPFTPGLMDGEIWQWIVDLCAKHGFKAQVALISKGGNINPHGDTTYADVWAFGVNLGKCDWHIQNDRNAKRTPARFVQKDLDAFYNSPTTTQMSLNGGEVFKFNCKHEHAVTNAAPDRWSVNVWAIANGPRAQSVNISGRLKQMLEKHPEVQEFIEVHQPGVVSTKSKKEDTMEEQSQTREKEEMKNFIIAGTGTRQLINEPREYRHRVLAYLVELLEGAKAKHGANNVQVISGMAEGFDECLALAAVKAGVPFVAAVPNPTYIQYYWTRSVTGKSRLKQGTDLLNQASEVVYVCQTHTSNLAKYNGRAGTANFERNQWMVDHADVVWAYNPTGDGGTGHCVNYAKGQGVKVFPIVVDKDNGGDDNIPDNGPKGPKTPKEEGPSAGSEKSQKKETEQEVVEMTKLENGVLLNPEQHGAYDAIINGDGNILMTGNAGTGKSFVLNQAVEALRLAGRKVLVMATTGIAATHINGFTYHSALRMHPDRTAEEVFNAITGGPLGDGGAWLDKFDLFIIDEVSMMHRDEIERLDSAMRMVFNPTKPFGGKRFCFVGDFLQIEPVDKTRRNQSNFAFMSRVWKEAGIVTHQLTRIVRQQDAYFAGFLNNVRQGIWTPDMQQIVDFAMKREKPESGVVYLVAKNDEAAKINDTRLAELDTPEFTYQAVDKVPNKYDFKSGTWGPDWTYWDRNCLAVKTLKLKVGAQVLCLLNHTDATGLTDLVNGDQGVVVHLDSRNVTVDFKRVGIVTLKMEKFQNGVEWEYRAQIPLRLAWAITMHKSQGMTLDAACISGANVFTAGQGYVALSRVKTLEGLYLDSFNPDKIWAAQEALDFYGLPGNLRGEEAEKHSNMVDPDDGNGIPVIDYTPQKPSGGETTKEVVVEKNNEEENKNSDEEVVMEGGTGMIKEYFVSYLSWVENPETGTKQMVYGRVITNDPDYYLKNCKVHEVIDRGSYQYKLLEQMFGGKSFCVNITPHTTPTAAYELGAGPGKQVVASSSSVKRPDIVFGWADFDSEVVFRLRGVTTKDYLSMKQFGLVIGNSEKMVKRLVELIKPVRGFVLNNEEKRLRIKIVTHAEIARAFPHLTDEALKVVADGINFTAVEIVKLAYRLNNSMSNRAKKKLLVDIEKGKITNHTIRILTSVDGVQGLIKGNTLTNNRAAINARMRELGIIGKGEVYDVFVCEDNFKTELGTDGSFELLTVEPHHGPGMVKTNDQMLAQYADVRGIFDYKELLRAFQAVMDKAYNDLVEGRDLTMFENMGYDRAVTESDKLSALLADKNASDINRMVGALNDLGLPLGVSQTLMFARANAIKKMFLSNLPEGQNWAAPSSLKRSFLFMPWAYRAYIMSKEAVYMAGYDVDLTNMEGEYHEPTQTFMIPGNLCAQIMGKLGGGDFDDEVGIHVRKMIMKDGSIRLVAFLVRTPNDWAEYYIIDISEFGPVFLAEDDDIEMPVIYEEDFDKFKVVSSAGQLPSKVNGSGRPAKTVWDWDLTVYNTSASDHKAAGVGGQVKTKMIWYSVNNRPFKTLPCANEDMIDALQQCKGDIADLMVLDGWSTAAMTHMLDKRTNSGDIDAYWYKSRNLDGTANMLVFKKMLTYETVRGSMAPKKSPIVKDLMLPRERMVRETFKKMLEYLNKNVMVIDELRGIVPKSEEARFRKTVTDLEKMFQDKPADVKIGDHYREVAAKILPKMLEYKAKVGDDAFNLYLLKIVWMSWFRHHEHVVIRKFNQVKNFDRWLYTAVKDSDLIMTDLFYDAMIWWRNKNGGK